MAGGAAEAPGEGSGGVRHFGDYELQEEIARGGMGIVWRARQISLDRPVALKLILAGQMASEVEVQRFLREAQAAANLDHPNIVPIYEVGQHAGHHYFSMRLIEGESLARRMADYQMGESGKQKAESRNAGVLGESGKRKAESRNAGNPGLDKKGLQERKARLVTLVARTARAVHHAHQRGILHRDLKPGNILIDRCGEPHVTDFGLAKRVDLPAEVTRSETVVGTPNYMSPEQARGRHKDLTTATDVFSLGAVLYHLLTGRPPFQAPTPWETLKQVVEQEPIRPSVLNRQVDADLETICLKCLEKDPHLRYASADALAEDLGRWLGEEPIHARPSTGVQRALKWVRRKPGATALIGLVILTALAGLGGVLWEWRQAVVARGEAEQHRRVARAAEQDAREKLWSSYLAQARATRWSGRPGRRFDSLAAISNAAAMRPSMELRNEAIACLGLFDVQVRRRWRLEPKPPAFQGVVMDAAFERYARAWPNGDVTLHRLENDAEILRLPGSGERELATLCFSADGRSLAEKYGSPKTNFFRVWNLGERTAVVWVPYEVSEASIAFAPDSHMVAAAEVGAIHLHDLPTGRALTRIPVASAPSALSFDPSGRRLAVCARDRAEAEVYDTRSGQRLLVLDHPGPVTWVGWSPDAHLLACSCVDQKIYLWNSFTGHRDVVLAGHHGAVMSVAFNRGGDLMVSDSWDGSTRFWDPATGENLLTCPAHVIALSGFSPDDQRAAFRETDDRAGVWDVATGKECRQWPAPPTFSAALDATGRILSACGRDGLRFWDVANRELVGLIPLEGGNCVVLHPDGKGLYVSSAKGLSRLALSLDPPGGQIRVGAAEPLWPAELEQISLSQDGMTLAASDAAESRVLVFDLRDPTKPRPLGRHAGVKFVSLSPDGRLAATGSWSGTSVKVWEVGSGELVKELPLEGAAAVGFSPDGQRLITANGAVCRVWKTASWEVAATLPRDQSGGVPSVFAISPSGQMAAVLRGRESQITLLELGSGRELATLDEGVPLGFDADGSHLAVCVQDPPKLVVWDLRRVREGLAALGLDWEMPPFPPAATCPAPTKLHLSLVAKP